PCSPGSPGTSTPSRRPGPRGWRPAVATPRRFGSRCSSSYASSARAWSWWPTRSNARPRRKRRNRPMIAPNLLTIELPEEVRRAAEIEARLIRRLLAPRPDLSIIDWAEQYRGLPATDGGGMWRVRMVPYLRTPLLALSDARTKEVAILKSAQAGATIGVLLNWILYSIHLDPSNILVLLPTEGEAQQSSKKKFKPAYDACEALAGTIADRRGRTGDNSVLEKSFPGGSLGMIGGVSSRGLRMVDRSEEH